MTDTREKHRAKFTSVVRIRPKEPASLWQRSSRCLVVLGLAANLLSVSCARAGFEPFGIPGDSRLASDSDADHSTVQDLRLDTRPELER